MAERGRGADWDAPAGGGGPGRFRRSNLPSPKGRDGIVSNAKRAYQVYKWKKRVESAKKLMDPTERSGEVVRQLYKAAPKIVSQVLGVGESSIKMHPAFLYHKVHFEVLARAVNAMSTRDQAEEAWKDIVGTAKKIRSRAKELEKQYTLSSSQPLKELRACEFFLERLHLGIDSTRYIGQAEAELEQLFESWVVLNDLVDGVTVGYEKYRRLAQKLEDSSQLGKIAAIALKRDQALAGLDDSIESEPVVEARNAVGRVEHLLDEWAAAVDRAIAVNSI